jgi:hypothetical protein
MMAKCQAGLPATPDPDAFDQYQIKYIVRALQGKVIESV